MKRVAGQDLLTEVRRDMVAAEQHLAELRRLEAYLLHKLESSGSQASLAPSAPSIEFAAHNYLRGLTQADAAEIVLRDANGGPLDTPAIVQLMVARGYEDRPQRQALVSSVFAVMSKLPNRFRKVSRGKWTVVPKEAELKREKSETGRRS